MSAPVVTHQMSPEAKAAYWKRMVEFYVRQAHMDGVDICVESVPLRPFAMGYKLPQVTAHVRRKEYSRSKT